MLDHRVRVVNAGVARGSVDLVLAKGREAVRAANVEHPVAPLDEPADRLDFELDGVAVAPRREMRALMGAALLFPVRLDEFHSTFFARRASLE